MHRQKEADFRPLFTGVLAEDANGIVQRLKDVGVEYRLPEGGGSVLVPCVKLAELRLTMAAAGLPKTCRMGFELFDKANLGATEFTEHVNYRRALDGESGTLHRIAGRSRAGSGAPDVFQGLGILRIPAARQGERDGEAQARGQTRGAQRDGSESPGFERGRKGYPPTRFRFSA